MKPQFYYADLHCHPNIKAFGHSFDRRKNARSDLWYTIKPSFLRRQIQRATGVTKFSQSDFTTLANAKAKIAFVSLYPLEKGFFFNKHVPRPLSALLANWGIEVGYKRVRYLQKHTDYFADLQREYNFVLQGRRNRHVNGRSAQWRLTRNWNEVEQVLAAENTMAIVLTIEGAHVFNCGLCAFGVQPDERQVLANVQAIKKWDYVPLFIGLAHNFNNDLCGHAPSLQRLGKLVDQEEGLGAGLTALGRKVIRALLDETSGRRIYIDLKHMSLRSRMEYYNLLKNEFAGQAIPLIVSHGSVTGLSMSGNKRKTACIDIFNTSELNFFDEEIVAIAKSEGLFGLQLDLSVHMGRQEIRQFLKSNRRELPVRKSARIIWNQLQYIAEVCDSNGLFAWGNTCIGSDFDGSIRPFPGVLTATGLEPLSKELLLLADRFLLSNTLSLPQNRNITAEEIVDRFVYANTENFLKQFYK